MIDSKGRYSYLWYMLTRETQEDVWGLVPWFAFWHKRRIAARGWRKYRESEGNM